MAKISENQVCGYKKINIGCGIDIIEEYINIDSQNYGQEINRDIERGLPFCSNSCIKIKAHSILEHIEKLQFVLNECHRVLKPEGILDMVVPNWQNEGAFRDPTHCRFFDEHTIDYLRGAKPYGYGFKVWNVIKTFHRPNTKETLHWHLSPKK